MNLINFKKMEASPGYMLLRNFRAKDDTKVLIILSEMLKKLKLARDNFNYTLEVKNADSIYSGGFTHKLEKIYMNLFLGKFHNEIVLDKPKLVHENCYQLNGSLYVPICFLERAPIDRISPKSKNQKNKLLLNLLCEQIVFDFNAKLIKFSRYKSIEISVFFKAIFNDTVYADFLQEIYTMFGLPQINDRVLNVNECKTKTLYTLGFTGLDKFQELELWEFFDNYVILSYEKEILKDYYGYSDIRNILRICIEFYKRDIDIDLADIRNRRLVLMEYLMHPIFSFYNRILWNFLDSDYKEYMVPKLPSNSLINDGFRGRMFGEQLFNITLPYITPMIHKISQNIVIVSKKIPKKWTSNHPSAMGVLCPISVSAQDMGSNLVATLETEVTFHGRIKSFNLNEPNESQNIKLPELIPNGKNVIDDTVIKGDYVLSRETGEIVCKLTPEEIDFKNEKRTLQDKNNGLNKIQQEDIQ